MEIERGCGGIGTHELRKERVLMCETVRYSRNLRVSISGETSR